MKLQRKFARIGWGFIAAALAALAVLLLLSCFGIIGVWFKLFAVVAVISAILACYISVRWFICPHCGEGRVPPQWKAGRRYYCSCCGKPFVYDDEPDEISQ